MVRSTPRGESIRSHFILSRPRCERTCPHQDDDCSFKVAWSINPHMTVGSADPVLAAHQHDAFAKKLASLGAIVHDVPFVHGAFDSVFSKDNAIVVQRPESGTFGLIAAPRHVERQPEQHARASALAGLGVSVEATAFAPLEGGDVVILPGARHAFLGYGFRSAPEAAMAIELFLDGEVTCLELRDPRLYHLDMALTVLENGTALVCAEAFTEASLKRLRAHPLVRSVIRVPLAEALRFGVNLVQVGRDILWGADAPVTTRALSQRGYRLHRVALDQFHLAGGSAACLVSRVHVQAEVAEESESFGPPSVAA